MTSIFSGNSHKLFYYFTYKSYKLYFRIEDFKKYEIILAKGNKYGIKQPDGSWDGLIGSLLSGEADVCVASLTINQVQNYF